MSDLVLVENLVIHQSDDQHVTWELSDTSGDTVNLTGCTVLAQVREEPEPSAALLHEWSTEIGNVRLTATTVSLVLSDSETWSWTFGYYDLHLTDPQGYTRVIVRGSVTVIPAVSRRALP